MVTAKQVINSTKPVIAKVPEGKTQLGSAGYDNPREDIEKVKKIREGTVAKTPVNATDIANKAYVDSVGGGGGTWTDTSTNTGTNKTLDDFSNRVEADEIHIRIRNESGSTMTKGQLVYISGYNVGQDRPLVTLADASADATMPMLAMINDGDIVNNADGHATVSGRVFDVDTSAFSIGAAVYVSTTAGGLSARPSGTTELVQRIGIVLRSHASNGVIQIIGAGRTNDIPNDIDHATDLQNIGTNTHAQIDTSITATGLNTTHRSSDGSDHSLSHAQSHNIASHSDTTATGAELETLTDGSETTLHTHAGTGGDVTATSNLTDIKIVQGDGGAKGVKTSTVSVGDVATNTTHRGLTNDPHNVTASQVGLGNVSNVGTSDIAYNATSWNTNTDNATKNAIRDKVETMDTAISSNTSASHAQSHNIASHSDTTATGAELNTLTGGGDTTLHDHAGISENTTHRASDGSDHSIVGTNTTAIASNTTHRNDNTQAHSDYLLNNAVDVGVQMTLTGDENTGDTQYTAQVLHGTDATPPTASNFPRGTIYIQYTA